MDITEIDKNLKSTAIKETDVVWKNIREKEFSIHGIFYSDEENHYRRMPKVIADSVSQGVSELSTCASGGRIRFVTDSPYIAVKAVIADMPVSSNISLGGQSGFSVYADGVFEGNLRPEYTNFNSAKDGKYVFASLAYARTGGMRNIEIYTPLYNRTYEVFVGLKAGSKLLSAKKYSNSLPIVFYGSSITQGGCASHSGNDYVSMVCRRLNLDFINLGFSGNAKAEPEMVDYLASLKASAMVLDYDFNAPSVEWLQQTHYPLYKKIRDEQPSVPIIFMTRPNFLYDPKNCIPRREVIYNNYLRAKANGDENVWFIDGETLLGTEEWDSCTVDNCHPNDLGFYRMAERVEQTLRQCLRYDSIK
ncbi:MAG: hypothetical protein E7373_06740 [Clostridiales bacterium]|nr:hypothetical protein [Clostridiales bacterium]